MLVVGAGAESVLFLREHSAMYRRPDRVAIVGLVDDDPALRGRWVHGLRVLGGLQQLTSIIKSNGVNEIVIIGDLDRGQFKQVLEAAGQYGVQVKQRKALLEPVAFDRIPNGIQTP